MKVPRILIIIPIIILAVLGSGYVLVTEGIINVSLQDKTNSALPVATIPFVSDPPNEAVMKNEVIEEPIGFKSSDQDLISAFLDTLGLKVTETFTVVTNVRLFDANQKVTVESSTLRVQPLDPRTVIVTPTDEDISQKRFFLNTDFSRQINDAGTNYHQFTGWDIVNEPKACIDTGDGFPYGCPLQVSVIVTKSCSPFQDQKICVQVIGSRSCDENCGSHSSILHGISKEVDISDWTRQGELIAKMDYSCNPSLQRSSQYIVIIKGEFTETYPLPCVTNGLFSQDVSKVVGDSNKMTFQMGAQATNMKKWNINALFNDPQVIGDSVIRRQAIEALKQFSIVKNDEQGTVLDLGFIEASFIGKSLFDNEKVVLQGVLETRIDDKTVSTHQVSGSGITVGKSIPLRVDGQEKFIFSLDKQNFNTDSFHTFKLILNDYVVNVGEGERQRTFEYHVPFLAYQLEFNVRANEILAYSVQDKAISVPKSDSTFVTCGLSSGVDPIKEPKVLPPVVSIIQNGFTIATTNPEAGQNKPNLGNNAEFCSTIPNLPRDTNLTFKIGNNFYEKNSPASQTNFFVKCTRTGCSSNIGFVSTVG